MQALTDEQVEQLYALRDYAFQLKRDGKIRANDVAYAMVCEMLLILAPRGTDGLA